jgi:class 3 adenylate cyclase
VFSHIEPDSPSGTETATVGFVDLAGFSAIADVFGDGVAIEVLELFEAMVGEALGDQASPVKWIGDEAMLAFPDPDTALRVLGRLLPACRAEARLPLTRAALNHGPVVRRGGDLFGTTVNVAARVTALADAGEHLLKAQIAVELKRLIAARGLTQTAAAGLTGIAQPDLSNLLRGQFRGCSVERLMRAVTALGQDVEIRIRPRGDETRPGRISVTDAAG